MNNLWNSLYLMVNMYIKSTIFTLMWGRSMNCILSVPSPNYILGLLLFNEFMSDLFFKLCDRCSLYNYADDNTISISHSDTDELKRQLQDCSEMTIQWFESNQMQVNSTKFQLMIMYSGLKPGPIELTTCNQVIQSVECVKLFGIHIDDKLDKHI